MGSPMKRREFVKAFISATALSPLVAGAESGRKAYRSGTITVTPFELASHLIRAFEESMADLGYVSGSNIIYEHRFANGRLERLPGLMRELVELNVDVM